MEFKFKDKNKFFPNFNRKNIFFSKLIIPSQENVINEIIEN